MFAPSLHLLEELKKLKILRKRYEKQLVNVGFQIDHLESNSKLDEVTDLQNITQLNDTYYPYLEMIYYEQMREKLDMSQALAALRTELDVFMKTVQNGHVDISSFDKIIDDLTKKTLVKSHQELEASRQHLLKLVNVFDSQVDNSRIDVIALIDKIDQILNKKTRSEK